MDDVWTAAPPAAFDSVQVDFDGADQASRYGGGRDLSRLAQDARDSEAA